eukprot:CAMPEP_0183301984 /NCGR_PEP_ID=MMETSP0160_2-20130417/7934_1 /TAXON_ID=2839 ORGANISM="Odontella Sinensis, Strain Grunow 1884" /NCGR_SAMPLE_ID=MMETSP0160_2 /ASSEMBLY_ACC=CAM_ASM_000250 /LENGTH=81 /DNA_ID=CAMNT_0025464699 /DNA_START=146 /DNA_END=388 /DNA_ORIENTATION=-
MPHHGEGLGTDECGTGEDEEGFVGTSALRDFFDDVGCHGVGEGGEEREVGSMLLLLLGALASRRLGGQVLVPVQGQRQVVE